MRMFSIERAANDWLYWRRRGLIPFPHHPCLGVEPQALLQHGKARRDNNDRDDLEIE
jgi:hypothetical protein